MDNVSKLVYHLTKTQPPSSTLPLSSGPNIPKNSGNNPLKSMEIMKKFNKLGNQSSGMNDNFQNDALDF
jgi:hypothetical protein